jgi:hypothetical protein
VFWAFAASVLILLLTITISNRGVVRVIGGVLLAVLLVIGLAQRLTNRGDPDPEKQRGKSVSPAAAVSAVPLEEVRVTDLTLEGGGAPFQLRGTIANTGADMHLRSVTVHIARKDCYEGAIDPSGCVTIWEDRHWMQVDLPPGSERKFSDSFYARTNVLRGRGTVKDEFKLIAASGHPEPR